MSYLYYANSEVQARIFCIQAALFAEDKHPRYPAGTVVDGKNMGGRFMPKAPENTSDFLEEVKDIIPEPIDPRNFDFTPPSPEAFKKRVGRALGNIGEAIAGASSEAAKGVEAIGDRLDKLPMSDVGKFLATEAYAFSKAVVLETVTEPISAAFALAAGSISMAAFCVPMAPKIANTIVGSVATSSFIGLVAGGYSIGVAGLGSISAVAALGAVSGGFALWKVIDILNRYGAERDIFRASWKLSKLNNEQLEDLLEEGEESSRKEYLEEMTKLSKKLVSGLERAGDKEKAKYVKEQLRQQGADI